MKLKFIRESLIMMFLGQIIENGTKWALLERLQFALSRMKVIKMSAALGAMFH